MALGQGYAGQDCSLARTLELIGERWTMLVLRDCFFGVSRFGELLAHLDLPRPVLASRLRQLVEAGVLLREPYAPGRDEYLLTERGIALWPALFALQQWSEATSPAGPRRLFRHIRCGTDIGGSGGCPVCMTVPAPSELEMRPGPGSVNLREDPVSVALREPHRLLERLSLA